MIELRHLRYFVAVAEQLHFGRAAQHLHIAQPALSRQIKRLEAELGVVLLERTQRSVALTAAGAAYMKSAKQLLEQMRRASTDAVRVANGETGRLKVTFIHSSTYKLTPTILSVFTKRHPNVTLNLQEMTVIEQLEALRRGEVDVALLRPPVEDRAIAFETVMRESFILAVPDGHVLADRAAVPLTSLRDEPFILFAARQSPLFNSRVIALCEGAGFTPNIVQEAIQIHTVLGLVGAGLGVALVPDAARYLNMPGVAMVPLADASEPVDVLLAWRNDARNPAVPLFRAAATDAARSILHSRRPADLRIDADHPIVDSL
ncbi:LysR substrate-binding domain-containing protein [Consotaella salsifontis]|uniref:Transcriptional regulator, LysR family n=1 Tax=Consotaella salsifontis TaxID=1365950 RepID=A0A1T4TAA5_9HYPH|nr:LysR substrate-binding domain-containing protein [Consotaella salsifontis]SKA37412.1 transcriptional regulator, LysR family [Consotaella salsifontis]